VFLLECFSDNLAIVNSTAGVLEQSLDLKLYFKFSIQEQYCGKKLTAFA